MATLAQTVTRICDDLSRPESEIGAVARREILSAIEFFAPRRFGFNERVLTATLSATNGYAFTQLVANDPEVADILAIDQVKTFFNNRSSTVARVNWLRVNALDQSNVSTGGPPDAWDAYNRHLLIYPRLNTSMSVQLAVHVKFVELQDADENAWLTEGEELIRSRACKQICARKLDDFEKSQMFAAMEGEALKGLLGRANVLMATGSLSANE
jgi:hypothetical protein